MASVDTARKQPPPEMDLSGPGPTAGAGAQGLDFLQQNARDGEGEKQPLFGGGGAADPNNEMISTPQVSGGGSVMTAAAAGITAPLPSSGGQATMSDMGLNQPSREEKPDLKPAFREDFSAEYLDRQRAQEFERKQADKQRRAQLGGVVQQYEDLVPLPPKEPFLKRYQSVAMWAAVAAFLLLCFFYWRAKKHTNSEVNN